MVCPLTKPCISWLEPVCQSSFLFSKSALVNKKTHNPQVVSAVALKAPDLYCVLQPPAACPIIPGAPYLYGIWLSQAFITHMETDYTGGVFVMAHTGKTRRKALLRQLICRGKRHDGIGKILVSVLIF